MSIVKLAREKHTCCGTKSCKDGKCSVKLPAQSYCLKGRVYQQTHEYAGRLCDFIAFFVHESDDWCAAIELKGGRIDASIVVQQLQGGAEIIDEIVGLGGTTSFVAVLVHRGRMSQNERRVLQRRRIKFGGRKHLIRPMRCGGLISAVV